VASLREHIEAREQTVHLMYEQLVNDRIQRLHDEIAQTRQVQGILRTGRLARLRRGWSRFGQPAHFGRTAKKVADAGLATVESLGVAPADH
jgi:hypothetical protein